MTATGQQIHDLIIEQAARIVQQEEQIAGLKHLLRTAIKVHGHVQMDTPEDKALHARAVETLWAGARRFGVTE